MDRRLVMLLGGFLLIVLLYTTLQPSLLLVRPEASLSHYQSQLERAECVNIVEVLGRNNRNVLQCGVDYARDLGALGKKVYVYAFQNDTCYTIDGPTLPQRCVVSLLLSPCPILYINGEGETNSYEGLLLVGVDESYEQGECAVLVDGKPALQYILEKKNATSESVEDAVQNNTSPNTTVGGE